MNSSVQIRTVSLEDEEAVRAVILRMLEDAPMAFGETLAEARGRSQQEWRAIVEHMIRPGATALLASDELGACGFLYADSANPEAPPETVVISRVWVAERQRGSGLGRRLMETAAEWSAQQHVSMLALGVTEMNVDALQFYEHLGYRQLGMRMPWPPDPTKQIILMGRELGA